MPGPRSGSSPGRSSARPGRSPGGCAPGRAAFCSPAAGRGTRTPRLPAGPSGLGTGAPGRGSGRLRPGERLSPGPPRRRRRREAARLSRPRRHSPPPTSRGPGVPRPRRDPRADPGAFGHPPAPTEPQLRLSGKRPRQQQRGINTRGHNHLVVVVVTQTLGKVQVGGVSGERAARRSRVKSYIHAGALVQEVHLEKPPGGLIDPPSGAFPGAGARANRRGTGAAGRRAFPSSGNDGGPGGGGGQRGKGAAEKCR